MNQLAMVHFDEEEEEMVSEEVRLERGIEEAGPRVLALGMMSPWAGTNGGGEEDECGVGGDDNDNIAAEEVLCETEEEGGGGEEGEEEGLGGKLGLYWRKEEDMGMSPKQRRGVVVQEVEEIEEEEEEAWLGSLGGGEVGIGVLDGDGDGGG